MLRIFSFVLVFVLLIGITPHYASAQATNQVASNEPTITERQAMLQQIQTLLQLIANLQKLLEEKRTAESAAGTPNKVADSAKVTVPLLAESDHVYGNPHAPVQFIMYADYDDPFSDRLNTTMQDLMSETFTGGDVVYILRHSPLLQLHPKADTVALAAECIARYNSNGAFWSFTNGYFKARRENPSFSTDTLLSQFLQATSLNSTDVQQCIKSKEFMSAVTNQQQEAIKAGLRGTPTSYVFANGKLAATVDDAQAKEVVAQIITQVIKTGTYDSELKLWAPTVQAKAKGTISVTQEAPSTIRVTGKLTPPADCSKAPQFEFLLKIADKASKTIQLDTCTTKTIDETVILTPKFSGSDFVELTLRQVDEANYVWVNYTQARWQVKSTNPLQLEIIDLTGKGEKG